jgi:hypothetical protein
MTFYDKPVITSVNESTVYAEHDILIMGDHFRKWNETLCIIDGTQVIPTWTECGLICQIPTMNPGLINISITGHKDDPIHDFFTIEVIRPPMVEALLYPDLVLNASSQKIDFVGKHFHPDRT